MKISKIEKLLNYGGFGMIKRVSYLRSSSNYGGNITISTSGSNCKLIYLDNIENLMSTLNFELETKKSTTKEEILIFLKSIFKETVHDNSIMLVLTTGSSYAADKKKHVEKFFDILFKVDVPIGYRGEYQSHYYCKIPGYEERIDEERFKNQEVKLQKYYENSDT